MKKQIAITGGIGSGKSTASKIIKDMGHPVFSCDEIYHKICGESEYINILASTFEGVVQNGAIDKNALRTLIFADEKARKTLDLISHPRIMSRLLESMAECKASLVFAEVPLLFEGNYQDLFDAVIVIRRNKEQRIKDICQRDGVEESFALAKIESQFDYDDEKNVSILQANNIYQIKNNHTIEDLRNSIERILKNI